MPIFSIDTETVLGISHFGVEATTGEGTVELSDEEVQQLIDLIRENGGETDVEKLELKDKYPEIYKILDEAFREVAANAEYDYWVRAGYENGWYEAAAEEIIEKCESKYGFHFEYKPEDFFIEGGTEVDEDALIDAKMEALQDYWIDDYCCEHSDKEIAFLSDVFNLEPDVDDVDYNVEIPPAIIKMAKDGQ